MKSSESLQIFDEKFVISNVRARFLHEALKKPERLHARICHAITELFESKYSGRELKSSPEQQCLILSGRKGFTITTWHEASKNIGRGEGLLVVSVDGMSFYAETEATKGKPSISYSGC